jgi:predicted Zn-dependent peptidase
MDQSVSKTVLSNGIRVLTRRIPHVSSVSMGVWVGVGARDESPAESGLSHFIEHMIFKGTRRRSAYQIAKEFDAIGGHTNAFTTMETTCYYAKVVDTHLETMVDILTDIFLNSVFSPDEIDRERPVIVQEIGMLEDAPEEYIHLLAGESYWGDNSLGRSILGSRENLSRFDADSIIGFFGKCYQPERIVVAAAGNVHHAPFVDLIAPAFESVKASGKGFPERKTPAATSRVSVHEKDLEQAHICLASRGVSISDPRRYAIALMNTIFGGNMSSRLFQEIRERRGLAYSVYSFISSFVDTGMFGAYAGIDPKDVAETTALILDEISRLHRSPVDRSELENAKEFTKGGLLLSAESVDNQMVRTAQNEINFERDVPIREVVEKIDAVTTEEISELAAELLGSGDLSLTALGPIREASLGPDPLGRAA